MSFVIVFFACLFLHFHSEKSSYADIFKDVNDPEAIFSVTGSLSLSLTHTRTQTHTRLFYGKDSNKGFYPREIFLCRGWEKTFEDTKKPDFIELLACQSNPPHSPGINQLPSCSMPSQKELPLEKSDSEISRTDSSL